MCFLPDSYFTTLTEHGKVLAKACDLFKGVKVVAANQQITEVACPPELHRVDGLIEMQAGSAFLVASGDHRVVVPGGKTVMARDLHENDQAARRVSFVRAVKRCFATSVTSSSV